jgi:regulatory protein
VHNRSTQNKPIPPLDNRRLRDLALHYAGRYATTKAKLSSYLQRKIKERGWKEGEPRCDLNRMMQEFTQLGYINDAAYAEARARSFVRRGYGKQRLEQDIYAAGISGTDAAGAREEAETGMFNSAQAFARRKRIGPYASAPASPELKRKQISAFIRAGHDMKIARAFIDAAPDEELDEDLFL